VVLTTLHRSAHSLHYERGGRVAHIGSSLRSSWQHDARADAVRIYVATRPK